jgi:hypothetical protein
LTEFCRAYRKPYIDTAADIDPMDVRSFGGHVLLSDPSRPGCLSCHNYLDEEDVRRTLRSPEDRSRDKDIYGIDPRALGEVGPSVVALNGVIASLAVTEYLKYVTEVLVPVPGPLRYDGRRGTVSLQVERVNNNCAYCDVNATPDQIDWERHIRQGLGRWVR